MQIFKEIFSFIFFISFLQLLCDDYKKWKHKHKHDAQKWKVCVEAECVCAGLELTKASFLWPIIILMAFQSDANSTNGKATVKLEKGGELCALIIGTLVEEKCAGVCGGGALISVAHLDQPEFIFLLSWNIWHHRKLTRKKVKHQICQRKSLIYYIKMIRFHPNV